MLVNWNIYMLAFPIEGIAKIIKSKNKLKETWQTNQGLGTYFILQITTKICMLKTL